MFKRIAPVIALVVTTLITTLAVRAEGVLRVEGTIVKWTPPATGGPTVITYALLQGPYAVPSGSQTLSPDNCGVMRPFANIIAASAEISEATAMQELQSAFIAWETVAAVRFVRVSDLSSAKIIIGATNSPVGRAFANLRLGGQHGLPSVAKSLGGSGDAPTNSGRHDTDAAASLIQQAYICLNPNKRWKTGFDGNLNVYDLRHTFMHEIGHAIGLDHPGSSGSIMGYRYDEQVSQLQPTDIKAVQWLYGPPAKE